MAKSWQPLPLQPSKNAPPILVCQEFSSVSYKIYITDLTNVWELWEDRKTIIRRSLDQNTSIDPSEDAEQMRLFLDKLRLAFTGGEDASLQVKAVKSRVGNETPDLEIEVTATLPKPLEPLVWTMHFALSDSGLMQRVTIPLIETHYAKIKEVESLLGALREKDHVVQKLVDKLEATGTDLGQVFPGANRKGYRNVSRKVAEERVKGLGPFDRDAWRKEMQAQYHEYGSRDVEDLVKEVVGNQGLHLGDRDGNAGWSRWLEELKTKPFRSAHTGVTEDPKADVKPTPKTAQDEAVDETDDDDDFQVQATPPRHKSPTKQEPTHAKSDHDTDDLDAPSQISVIPDSVPIDPSPQLSSKPKRLGAIGGIKKPSQTTIPSPSPQKSPSPVQNADSAMDTDEDTATEDGAPLPSRAKSPPPEKPKKMGLGKIGGKRKEATPAPTLESEASSLKIPVQESPAPERKAKGKLGHIGKKAKAAETADQDESRGRAVEAKQKTPPPQPRETSLERADRKRQELKRQLEEKAKAPVKKKRKF